MAFGQVPQSDRRKIHFATEVVRVSKDVRVMERRAFRLLPTAGIALATPFLVWFAIGDRSFRGTGGVGLSR